MNGFEPMVCPNCGWRFSARAPACPACGYRFAPLARAAPAHWTSSPWTVVAAALVAFVALAAWGVAGFAWRMSPSQVTTTRAYQDALKLAEASREVQNVLGDHLTSSSARGPAVKRYGSQFAERQVALTGSRGSGTLYGTANEINGKCTGATSATLADFGLAGVPGTVVLNPEGGAEFRIVGEASKKDIMSRVEWLLSDRSSQKPKELQKNL